MRKLTLLIDDDVYEGLHLTAGRGQIGRFVSEKVRPYLVTKKAATGQSGYGMLGHLARTFTGEEEAAAAQHYFAARYAGKTAVASKRKPKPAAPRKAAHSSRRSKP